MQVFVPDPDFRTSVQALDARRLFKQLVEAYQLLLLLHGVPKPDGSARKAWSSHPATVQWRPWPGALARYAQEALRECESRGIRTEAMRRNLEPFPLEGPNPAWLGDDRIHCSHRARLLQKDFEHYRQLGWSETNDPELAKREYLWAVPAEDGATYSVRRIEKKA